MPDLRTLKLETPALGSTVALLETFRGVEGMSRLFEFDLEFHSPRTDLAAKDFLAKSATITLDFGDDYKRYFNGIVRRFSAAGVDEVGYRTYRLEVVPSLWLLTRQSNCRIFENKTTKDILGAVLGDAGFPFETDLVTGARATGHQRVYCVQYRETDFNFVSRLMEEEGIFYFFRQGNGVHTMVLADSVTAYQDCDEPNLAYTQGNTVNFDVTLWDHGYEFISGKWTQNDYNFETPNTDLLTTTNTRLDVPNATSYEMYDYPGFYDQKPSDGDALTITRIEGEEATYELIEAASVNCTLKTAGKVKMARHPITAEAGKGYAIISVSHDAWAHAQTQGGNATGYSAHIICLPDSVPFRPPRITPKPMIHGLQTAVVTGPSGEEINTDKYGRIQVLFYWDRDKTTSCWIRVAQSIAGKQWGAIYLPRIGQEVVVSFLEGDPDRPLVTGSVYNDDNMPPYTLSDNKTQSGYKTRSTTGGSSTNYNELRFEDKIGSEEIHIQAEKDFTTLVKHDDTLTVENDQTITVKNDRTETVQEGNETVTISQGNRTVAVSQGNESLTVSQGNRTVTVSQGNDSLTVSMGNHSIQVSIGSSSIEAMQSIQLTVGGNSIKIDQSGVTISGITVNINGSVQTQVQGALVDISGTLVQIN